MRAGNSAVMRPRFAGLVFLAALLSGCAPAGDGTAPGAGLRDGRWVGRFQSSLGVLGCPTRGTMEVQIRAGRFTGAARAPGVTMTVSGALAASGEIVDGVFFRDGRAAALMTGTFAADAAAGRWQGASCEGVWSLRKFS